MHSILEDFLSKDEGPVHVGVVKSVNINSGYGFIDCPETFNQYGRDVFVHHVQINGFNTGDRVKFIVQRNSQGHPQAYDLEEAQEKDFPQQDSSKPNKPRVSVDDRADIEPSLPLHAGTIKSFDGNKGYGFIDCPEVFATSSRDVFIHRLQLQNFGVG